MFYHSETNQYIREGTAFTIKGTKYGAGWLNTSTPAQKDAIGLVEVTTVGVREDDRYYYVSEELRGSELHIINIRKSDEQIAEMEKALKQSTIDQKEAATMLPRVVREFMLAAFEAQAAAAGVDPLTNFGYKKVKELDTEIAALREQL